MRAVTRSRLAFVCLATAALLGLLLPAPARAATVIQTTTLAGTTAGSPSFSHLTASLNRSWSFDQFNPALGTLTGVTFAAHVDATGYAHEINPFATPTSWTPSLEFLSYGSLLSGGASDTHPFAFQSSPFSGVSTPIAPGNSSSFAHTFTRDLSATFSEPAALAAWTGMADGLFSLNTGTSSFNSYGGTNVSASTVVTLTYTYATLPLSTPSPANAPDGGWSLLMLAPLAAGLLAAASRRRHA